MIKFGPVAQRITCLTMNQEIAGSNPAWIECIFLVITFYFFFFDVLLFKIHERSHNLAFHTIQLKIFKNSKNSKQTYSEKLK